MRLTVFSPYRPTRHPNMTIFVPVYSGWTQGTCCIANHSQNRCWWGATPSPSLCKPSVPDSQMRMTVFSLYRPTRHPNMTIFLPIYSGWTQGTCCIANHSQNRCWWGATPSQSLCDPSVLFGAKSGPQKWVAIDLHD